MKLLLLPMFTYFFAIFLTFVVVLAACLTLWELCAIFKGFWIWYTFVRFEVFADWLRFLMFCCGWFKLFCWNVNWRLFLFSCRAGAVFWYLTSMDEFDAGWIVLVLLIGFCSIDFRLKFPIGFRPGVELELFKFGCLPDFWVLKTALCFCKCAFMTSKLLFAFIAARLGW